MMRGLAMDSLLSAHPAKKWLVRKKSALAHAGPVGDKARCAIARRLTMITLCRWGSAEYELAALVGLPADVQVVESPREADVVVVPSTRQVGPNDVPKARLVITTTSGFDNLDVPALRAVGVRCARLPLARRDAVVETALGMILALTRRFGPFQTAASANRWDRKHLHDYDARLLGTVGVVGMGVIGTKVAAVLTAFGARVIEVRRGDPLPTKVDAVSFHCALTAENRGFADATWLAQLPPHCVVVNTARGKLLDVAAASAALRDGKLGGLGLDVFPEEPAELARFVHPKAIVLPHAAGWHPGLGAAISEGVAVAVAALSAGNPIPWSL